MVTNNFTFLSNDGKTAVHAVKWTPDSGEYKAILQISHGMIEYIERYRPFAEFLNEHGIDAFFPILRSVTSLEDALNNENAYNNLTATAYQVFRLLEVNNEKNQG